jgi:sigma-B regulation protein RsbU (phosphoserine phosphatase)
MDESEIGFYLLDVCGHGVPAAMLSVTLSMMLTPDATHGSPLKRYDSTSGLTEVLSPGDAIRELNRRFQSKDDRYFTMIYGLFDTRSSTLRMAQAGHPGPVLMRKDAAPRIVGDGGMPVGLWPAIDFDCFELPILTGDRLLLYSDGVTECMNGHGEAFGEERLLAFLQPRARQTLNHLLEELLAEVKGWCGNTEFADDISLLAIEFTEDGTL